MAYLNVAAVIKRLKRSYISAVRRVASPGGIEKRRQKPKLPQNQFTLQVSVKARWTFAAVSSVRFRRLRLRQVLQRLRVRSIGVEARCVNCVFATDCSVAASAMQY